MIVTAGEVEGELDSLALDCVQSLSSASHTAIASQVALLRASQPKFKRGAYYDVHIREYSRLPDLGQEPHI